MDMERRQAPRGDRALRNLAWVTTAGLLVVVIMGSLVTNTGSARGCGGTWPLCDGRFVPEMALQSLVEYSHRAVAGFVGLMVGVLAVWAWIARPRSRRIRILAAVGAGFIVVQSLLGGADVLWPEAPAVLALHFGFALVAFAGVLLLAVALGDPQESAPAAARPAAAGPAVTPRAQSEVLPPGFAAWTWITLAYVYCLIYLGSYVAHTGATAACSGWPLCYGWSGMPLTGDAGITMAHRLAALMALVLIGWLHTTSRPVRRERPDLFRGTSLALTLVVLQALSGALVVGTPPLGTILLHVTLATALFGALAHVCLLTVAVGGASGEARRPAVRSGGPVRMGAKG
jgi:cytochrome c oxidase assembly protein subunit 15